MSAVREHGRGALRWLALDALERRGVRHGFTLRRGGASRGAFSSLNFSSRAGDRPERVRENWRRIEAAAGLPVRGWGLLSQVHGVRVDRVAAGGRACHHRREHPEADGMVTASPGVALGILTADCLPVVLGIPGAPAVAVAHAGWRGTLGGIAPAAARELARLAGGAVGDVVAGLGPSIGRCCYQVGEEVRAAFLAAWGPALARRILTRSDPWRLDLPAANLIQLREAGIPARQLARVPLCTCCRKDLFFSYRRDGERSGRMLNFAVGAGPGGTDRPRRVPAGRASAGGRRA